ncbi:hypothetical protein [Ferribacterium limneticum]|uniref:hypothetical protein n=1 Tax=Ferribacterium limneticum TaxID=76259 RepID=UPI001CF8C96E|nr:hypothetical protein [Ferribacterium limneticum]UCV24908.1 hypothetical protein KI613_10600 [Ferribacterium limneticum]
MVTADRCLHLGRSNLHLDSHIEFPAKVEPLTNQGTKPNVHIVPSSGQTHEQLLMTKSLHEHLLMSMVLENIFMELRDYIDTGAKKAGSLTALGLMLGMSQPQISGVKAHRRSLPMKAAVELAEFIGADLKAVIAANELVTEKDEKKRAFWHPFVNHAKAASIALAFSLVTNFVTPSPAEAAPLRYEARADFVLC